MRAGSNRGQTYIFRPREDEQSRKAHNHGHDPQPVGSPDREAAGCSGRVDEDGINHCDEV